jgi:hypothetical protein
MIEGRRDFGKVTVKIYTVTLPTKFNYLPLQEDFSL